MKFIYFFLFLILISACGSHEECSCVAKTPQDSIEAVKQCRKDSIKKFNDQKEDVVIVTNTRNNADSILKLELHLSAFGVESDDFPSIDGEINFVKNTSHCEKSFYNPAYKSSSYSFSKKEIQDLSDILQKTDWEKIKKDYTTNRSDQPTSTLIITTKNKVYTIKDYGLEGDDPLQKIYKIVYKF